MSAFEIWWAKKFKGFRYGPEETENAKAWAHEGWLACAAEAERLCRDHDKGCPLKSVACHNIDADAIAKLAEVERGS